MPKSSQKDLGCNTMIISDHFWIPFTNFIYEYHLWTLYHVWIYNLWILYHLWISFMNIMYEYHVWIYNLWILYHLWISYMNLRGCYKFLAFNLCVTCTSRVGSIPGLRTTTRPSVETAGGLCRRAASPPAERCIYFEKDEYFEIRCFVYLTLS